MAQFYGTSKVWQEIKGKLESVQLKANHPREINTLLDNCALEYEQQLNNALESLEDAILLLEQDVNKEREQTQKELAVYSEKISLDIEQAEVTLDFYQHDRNAFNSIQNSLKARRETKKLERLKKRMQDYRDEIEKPLKLKENELEQKSDYKAWSFN